MEIIDTYNYYTKNYNLNDYDKYIEKFGDYKFLGWGKVRDGETGEQLIIGAVGFRIFDYNLFDYFKDYQSFVPTDRQEIIYKEVLSKTDSLNPNLTLEFLHYLYDYIKDDFAENDYYYKIVSKEDDWDFGNPATFRVNGKLIRISTTHTTFKDHEHKDFAEYQYGNENYGLVDWMQLDCPTEWIKIEDTQELKTDDGMTVHFKKTYYKEIAVDKLKNLFKLCELAINADIKIQRNTDWGY